MCNIDRLALDVEVDKIIQNMNIFSTRQTSSLFCYPRSTRHACFNDTAMSFHQSLHRSQTPQRLTPVM